MKSHLSNAITSASIGLGNGYDETILEAIAQGGGGAHRFAADIDEAVGAIAAVVAIAVSVIQESSLPTSVTTVLDASNRLPGASGNVTTEDLEYMLQRMGVTTGVDVPALLALRQRVADWLAGETLHGALWQAGLPRHAQPTLAAAAV
mgnify:CR=1 FL=1